MQHFFADDNRAVHLLVLLFPHTVCHNNLCLLKKSKMQFISNALLVVDLQTFFFCSSCSDYIFKGFTRSGRLNCNDVILCPFCISDDGKLSFEEFNTYFADGILTTEELQELFYSIDGRQNRWPFRYELLQSCWVSILVRKAIISSLYHGLNPAVKMARTSHFLSNRETFAQQ